MACPDIQEAPHGEALPRGLGSAFRVAHQRATKREQLPSPHRCRPSARALHIARPPETRLAPCTRPGADLRAQDYRRPSPPGNRQVLPTRRRRLLVHLGSVGRPLHPEARDSRGLRLQRSSPGVLSVPRTEGAGSVRESRVPRRRGRGIFLLPQGGVRQGRRHREWRRPRDVHGKAAGASSCSGRREHPCHLRRTRSVRRLDRCQDRFRHRRGGPREVRRARQEGGTRLCRVDTRGGAGAGGGAVGRLPGPRPLHGSETVP